MKTTESEIRAIKRALHRYMTGISLKQFTVQGYSLSLGTVDHHPALYFHDPASYDYEFLRNYSVESVLETLAARILRDVLQS